MYSLTYGTDTCMNQSPTCCLYSPRYMLASIHVLLSCVVELLYCCNCICFVLFLDNNPCDQNPCKHGGNCYTSGQGTSYFCECASDYYGNNCESKH